MIQQAYKYVSLSLWPYLTFFRAENHLHMKSSGWGLERVSFHGNKMFYSRRLFSVELLAHQVSMVCAANWPIL